MLLSSSYKYYTPVRQTGLVFSALKTYGVWHKPFIMRFCSGFMGYVSTLVMPKDILGQNHSMVWMKNMKNNFCWLFLTLLFGCFSYVWPERRFYWTNESASYVQRKQRLNIQIKGGGMSQSTSSNTSIHC